MRFPASATLVLPWLLAIGIATATAQPTTGTLQATPSARDQPARPPAAAPRQPVRQAAPAKPATPPVVTPHGPTQPHRPATSTTAGTEKTRSTPVPVVPAVPPPVAANETKALTPDKLPDPEKPEGAPSKLPRFASLRSDDVNMRAGPGTRYRIDWVYKRRDLPVEIEREFDVWRWVRDSDGIQGWVHQATLMGRRSFVVQKADATLRAEPSDAAGAVAILKPGVIGRIRICEASSDWCNVQTGSYRGFLRRAQVWGLLPGEAISP